MDRTNGEIGSIVAVCNAQLHLACAVQAMYPLQSQNHPNQIGCQHCGQIITEITLLDQYDVWLNRLRSEAYVAEHILSLSTDANDNNNTMIYRDNVKNALIECEQMGTKLMNRRDPRGRHSRRARQQPY